MKVLLIPALALSLLASGCGTTGGIDTGKVSSTIADIQSAAVTLCSFSPSVSTVSAILSALGVPVVGMVPEIANQICSAISSHSARRSSGTPRMVVRGKVVLVTGRFVHR